MTYEDDEQNERLLEMLAHMEAREQERRIADAEDVLATTPDAAEFPMPNTVHPALAHYAPAVMAADPRMGYLRIPKPRPTAAFQKDEALEPTALALDVLILTARKVTGPAPFTNTVRPWIDQSAMYVWWAWVDDLGRHIATDAELVWRY